MIKLKKKLVMIGAGGHAKVCYDIAQKMHKWNEIIVLDDNLENNYFEIAGSIHEFKNYIDNAEFFVAIGDNKTREKFTNDLIKESAQISTLFHPQAVIASDVQVGEGTVVMAGVVINSATKIGIGCIINTSSSIDHDNTIGDFVHISPGVCSAGSVEIGNRTWIGIGSNLSNDKKIGSNIIVGAGSTVVNDIEKEGTYIGAPAKRVESTKL